MWAALLIACTPKIIEPKVFAVDFPRNEPRARPEPVLQVDECNPRAIKAGDLVDCTGLLIANRDAETCRYDEADMRFWEREARAQWAWRDFDRSVCGDATAALRWELDVTKKAELTQRRLVPIAFIGGTAVGAGLTLLLVEAISASLSR